MARRRRRRGSSGLDGWIELVALCPWWVGVLLVGVAYVGLHGYAMAPLDMAGMRAAERVFPSVAKALAHIGQYVVPAMCLLGAGLSAWRRQGRRPPMGDTSLRGTEPLGASAPEAAASCTVCGSIMERRLMRQGTHAEQAYWGCSRFPSCRGMRKAP
jgi:hypothetical protein